MLSLLRPSNDPAEPVIDTRVLILDPNSDHNAAGFPQKSPPGTAKLPASKPTPSERRH
jgi:hypothetical protein